jgi:hypothetical protein
MDESKRKSIFSPSSLGDRAAHGLIGIGPKYSAEAKLPAIERLLPKTGAKPLQGITADLKGPTGKDPVRLLMVGFDYDRNRAVFFRSVAATRTGLGSGAPAPNAVTLAGAVHGSTNAPINYFDEPATLPNYPDRIWDGGITGNNNPVLAGVVEAVVCGIAPTDIRALSLGTATVVLPLAPAGAPDSPFLAKRSDPSLIGDIGKLATAVLDDPPDCASFIAHAMTGGNPGLDTSVISRIVRMNPLISPVNAGAPPGWTPSQFKYLRDLGMDAVEPNQVEYIADWCQLWLADTVPNQPLRMDGPTMNVEVGYGRFSEARNAWEVLFR